MKGFTLIEILLCCLLFGLGMLGALSCQIYARQQVLQAQQRMIAGAVATDVLSSLQSVSATSDNFQADIRQPISAAVCHQAGSCNAQQLLQAQLAASVEPILNPNTPVLPKAQLCIRTGANGPALNLSWQPVESPPFKAYSTICPVRPGDFQLELLPERGL